MSKVILIDMIHYENGYISVMEGITEDIEVDVKTLDVVERGLRGWGRANAVVKIYGVDCGFYLAIVP